MKRLWCSRSGTNNSGITTTRLIKRSREEVQARHYAHSTVKTYELGLQRFHRRRRPREMGSAEINAFLTHLAVEAQVSTSIRNHALSALQFLYRELLDRDLELDGALPAHTRRGLPVVLTQEDVRVVIERLDETEALVVGLL